MTIFRFCQGCSLSLVLSFMLTHALNPPLAAIAPPPASQDPATLHPEDAFLLSDFSSVSLSTPSSSQAASAAMSARQNGAAFGPSAKTNLTANEVTWLRRTEYLGADAIRKKAEAS